MPSLSRSRLSARILSFCQPAPCLERAHTSLSSYRQDRRRSKRIYSTYQEKKKRETISTDASRSSSNPYSTLSSNPYSTTSSHPKSRATTPGLTSGTTTEDREEEAEEEEAWTDPPTARNSYGYSVDSLCVLWRAEVDEWKPFWRAEVKSIAPAWKPWDAVYGNSWSDDRRNSGWAGPRRRVGFADDPWTLPPLDESASLGVST